MKSQRQEVHLLSSEEINELWGWFDFDVSDRKSFRSKILTNNKLNGRLPFGVISWAPKIHFRSYGQRAIAYWGSFDIDGSIRLVQHPSGLYSISSQIPQDTYILYPIDKEYKSLSARLITEEFTPLPSQSHR